MTDIQVKSILKTIPSNVKPYLGLATFEIVVPQYVWMELLTHKRLVRNATSNRAMNVEKNVNMGYYEPPVFYKQGEGMSSGEPMDEEHQNMARMTYKKVWELTSDFSVRLRELGVSKEQSSRLLPSIKMMRGLVTANVRAWSAFLELRDHPTADVAMQILAKKIKKELEFEDWSISKSHFPFLRPNDKFDQDLQMYKVLGARIARLSYGKTGDVVKDIVEDEKLGASLLKRKHGSPFEHMAYFKKEPNYSALYSYQDSVLYSSGWENVRSILEKN